MFLSKCIIYVFSDFRKLERDFPTVKSQTMVDQCVDLGVWCNDVTNSGGRWSMENLVRFIVSAKQFGYVLM